MSRAPTLVLAVAGLCLAAVLPGLPRAPGAVGESVPTQETAVAEERIDEVRARIDELERELGELLAARGAAGLEGEQSVKPGINDSWKSDNIRPLIQRLEAESREIFIESDTIAAAVGLLPGMEVADVGAGSGFMAQIFAKIVGEEGRVYAVDINQTLMERLATAAEVEGVPNLETVVCGEKSVDLPPGSVDLVFVCDTYHHFEYPRNTLHSIHQALRPGGQLVVVEFHRIPGTSRDWVLDHVRAGEDVFTAEIVGAGFDLINRHYLPQLEENYMLRFRKR